MAKKGVIQIVVTSRMKELVKKMGLRSDGKLVDAVNVKVVEMLQAAGDRCKGNKRGTVRGYDL